MIRHAGVIHPKITCAIAIIARCRHRREAIVVFIVLPFWLAEPRRHRSLLAGGGQILQMSFSAPAYRLAGGLARSVFSPGRHQRPIVVSEVPAPVHVHDIRRTQPQPCHAMRPSGIRVGSHNQVGGKLGSGSNGCSMPKQIAFDLRDADRYPTLCIVM